MTSALIYVGLIVLFLVLVKVTKQGQAHQDTRDQNTKDVPWDKASLGHIAGCAAATALACLLGVDPRAAFAITVAGGLAYEFVQGYVSWWDVGWDALGSLVVALAWWVLAA